MLTQIHLPKSIEKGQIDIPYPHQINDAILVFPHDNLPPVYVWSGYPRPNYLDEEDHRGEQEKEFDQIKDAVKFTVDFYGVVSKVYGEKVAQLAKELAKQAKGKKLHTAEDALKAYDKYKNVLNKKFSTKDRDAIVKALKSLDAKIVAKNLKIFSKAFGYTGYAVDINDLKNEFLKATTSGNWRPFFVKAETIFVGYAAVTIVAYIFAIMTGSYIGIIGFAFLLATVGALIDDDLMEKINKLIGI
jgi:Colicin pore forming domain.